MGCSQGATPFRGRSTSEARGLQGRWSRPPSDMDIDHAVTHPATATCSFWTQGVAHPDLAGCLDFALVKRFCSNTSSRTCVASSEQVALRSFEVACALLATC